MFSQQDSARNRRRIAAAILAAAAVNSTVGGGKTAGKTGVPGAPGGGPAPPGIDQGPYYSDLSNWKPFKGYQTSGTIVENAGALGPDDYYVDPKFPGTDMPWGPQHGKNAGQTDEYGNVYQAVNNDAWQGGAIPLASALGGADKSLPPHAQLWGGPTADGPPAWLVQLVQEAKGMPEGAAKQARIRHIMSSLTGPDVPWHAVHYANQQFGFADGEN